MENRIPNTIQRTEVASNLRLALERPVYPCDERFAQHGFEYLLVVTKIRVVPGEGPIVRELSPVGDYIKRQLFHEVTKASFYALQHVLRILEPYMIESWVVLEFEGKGAEYSVHTRRFSRE